jgi:hypothetical protein
MDLPMRPVRAREEKLTQLEPFLKLSFFKPQVRGLEKLALKIG